jgi:hypothetical protein
MASARQGNAEAIDSESLPASDRLFCRPAVPLNSPRFEGGGLSTHLVEHTAC